MPRVPVEGLDYSNLLDKADDIWWCCGGLNCYENFTSSDAYSDHVVLKHGYNAIPSSNAFREIGDPS